MKLSLSTLALALTAVNTVSALKETYSCNNNMCNGACTPTDGGRDGIPTEVQWGEGQPWCYLRKTGLRPGSEISPIHCLPGIGCSVPASGAVCLTKDWDEEKGGCTL